MIIAGIGYRTICTEADILKAINFACCDFTISTELVTMLATSEIKKNDPAILNVAKMLNVPLHFVSYKDLKTVSHLILTHSAISLRVTGSPCLSEAAALFSAGEHGCLLGPRIIHNSVTCAIATDGDQL